MPFLLRVHYFRRISSYQYVYKYLYNQWSGSLNQLINLCVFTRVREQTLSTFIFLSDGIVAMSSFFFSVCIHDIVLSIHQFTISIATRFDDFGNELNQFIPNCLNFYQFPSLYSVPYQALIHSEYNRFCTYLPTFLPSYFLCCVIM